MRFVPCFKEPRSVRKLRNYIGDNIFITVFTLLNAADVSKITNKRRTQSEECGVYSKIMRKKKTNRYGTTR